MIPRSFTSFYFPCLFRKGLLVNIAHIEGDSNELEFSYYLFYFFRYFTAYSLPYSMVPNRLLDLLEALLPLAWKNLQIEVHI